MEFEEMKKVWDEQNKETLYVINEDALHKSVKAKKRKATRISDTNEFGLMLINVLVGGYQFYEGYVKGHDLWDYAMGTLMFAVVGYLVFVRKGRLQKERNFDLTMLGELDQAISSTISNIKLGSTMVWWYMVPVALLVFSRFIAEGVDWYFWLIIIGMFSLAIWLGRWEAQRCHTPRLVKLQAMRTKLLEEV